MNVSFLLSLTEFSGSTAEQVSIEFAFVHRTIILRMFKHRKICQDFQGESFVYLFNLYLMLP